METAYEPPNIHIIDIYLYKIVITSRSHTLLKE